MTDRREPVATACAWRSSRAGWTASSRKMANTLFRTARSGVLNTGARLLLRACSPPTAELLAAAESLPIHVMIGPDLIAALR